MESLEKMWAWLKDRKKGVAVVGGLLLAIALSTEGCILTPKTESLLRLGETVTVEQFEREVIEVQADLTKRGSELEADTVKYADLADIGYADLEAQAARIQQALDLLGGTLTTIASGGISAVNPSGLIVPALSLFGLAYGVKTYAKERKKIKRKK